MGSRCRSERPLRRSWGNYHETKPVSARRRMSAIMVSRDQRRGGHRGVPSLEASDHRSLIVQLLSWPGNSPLAKASASQTQLLVAIGKAMSATAVVALIPTMGPLRPYGPGAHLQRGRQCRTIGSTADGCLDPPDVL